jgi:hypothetical protein
LLTLFRNTTETMRTITLSVPEDFNDRYLMELLLGLGISSVEGSPSGVNEDAAAQRGRILEKLAASKVFSSISDPVDWQREQRKDRKLL